MKRILAVMLALLLGTAGVALAHSIRTEAENMTLANGATLSASGTEVLFDDAGEQVSASDIGHYQGTDVFVRARRNSAGNQLCVRLFVDGTSAGDRCLGPGNTANNDLNWTVPHDENSDMIVRGVGISGSEKVWINWVDAYGPNEEPPPPPPAGEIVWTGDAENPTGEDWNRIFTAPPFCSATPENGLAPNNHGGYHERVSSNPTPLQGEYAYKGKVTDGYDCSQERTELSQMERDHQFLPNTQNWEAFAIWLGPDFNVNRDATGASTLYQHKPVPSDNPTTSLKVGEGEWQWNTQGGSPSNPQKDSVQVGAAETGHWYKFILYTEYTSNSDGVTELYSDVPDGPGGEVVQVGSFEKPTLYTNTLAIRPNMGFYRQSEDSGTETFAHDGYTVATEREAAESNAFGE